METILQLEWLAQAGYVGLLIGTFLAGTVLSLSSDVLMVAAMLAHCDPWICLVVATVGNSAGIITSYLLGRVGRWQWIEKWFGVKEATLEKQKARVEKYGIWLAFFGWLPVVGQLFMLALGFYKAKPVPVMALTLAGTFCRFLVWVVLYIYFGEAFIGAVEGFIKNFS